MLRHVSRLEEEEQRQLRSDPESTGRQRGEGEAESRGKRQGEFSLNRGMRKLFRLRERSSDERESVLAAVLFSNRQTADFYCIFKLSRA